MKVIALSALLFIMLPFTAGADQLGNKASSFRLSDTQGTTVALDDFAGKVILLNFWASWCTSCREELPVLDRLYQKYRDHGFVVIGISVDSSADRAAAFLKKRPVGFPVLMDTRGDVAEAYRFSGLPASFLVGRDGMIVRQYRGFDTEFIPRYEKEITELLQGK